MNSSIMQYITSFFEGRVRIRHPELRKSGCEEQIWALLGQIPGILTLTVEQKTGSLLLEYDPEVLPTNKLLELAEQWSYAHPV